MIEQLKNEVKKRHLESKQLMQENEELRLNIKEMGKYNENFIGDDAQL
jgi:hypothetical protein